jgi:PTS system ascorbate-specific IIA component
MPRLLIVAHAPLASSLQAVAQHVYPDCVWQLAAVDVLPGMSGDEARASVAAALAAHPGEQVLILTDVENATPSNAALAVADPARMRLVTGVNVPMMWRALCYAEQPITELAQRALEGAVRGIQQVGPAAPPPQGQP